MNVDFNDNAIRLFSTVSLIVFLILSVNVVKQDLAAQLIPNSLLLRFLKIGATMYVILLVYGILQDDKSALNYTQAAVVNAAIALPVGYLLWYFDIYSPGDAKYFAIAALFIPMETYAYQFVPFFPSLLVLINAYLIAFLSMFAYTLYLIARRLIEPASRSYFSIEYARHVVGLACSKAADLKFWAGLAGMLFYMVSIILIMRMMSDSIQKYIHISSGSFTILTVLVLYFASNRLRVLMKASRIFSWLAYLLFTVVLFFQQFVLGQSILLTIAQTVAASFFMVVFIPIARLMIDVYYEALDTTRVGKVKMGIVLTQETVEKLMKTWAVEVPALVPLTDEQSQSIKDIVPNMETIRMVKHITFGPFIFAGALFTMMARHTIMHYL